MKWRCTVWFVFLSAMLVHQAKSQGFATEVSQFVGDNARPFLQPIADGLHSSIHAGIFSPMPESEGLHVSLRVVGMGVPIPDEKKTFKPKPYNKPVEFQRGGITYIGDLEIAPNELPTAAGLGKKYTFTGRLKRIRPKGLPYIPNPIYDAIQQDATVTVGGFADVSSVLLGTTQLTIGSLLRTEIDFRFLPTIRVDDIGEVKMFGVGLRHDVGSYFSLPMATSLHVMYQSLTVQANEKEFTASLDQSSVSVQLHFSKTFPVGILQFVPNIACGYESTNLDVGYNFADPYIGKQNLTFNGGGSLRFAGGLHTKLWKIIFSADYNLALMNGFSVGLGLEI